MGNIGFTEIFIIVFILLLLFGGKAIPSIGKNIGEGIKQFRKSMNGDDEKNKNK
jgi:sec-independent protein translocase protein TatA